MVQEKEASIRELEQRLPVVEARVHRNGRLEKAGAITMFTGLGLCMGLGVARSAGLALSPVVSAVLPMGVVITGAGLLGWGQWDNIGKGMELSNLRMELPHQRRLRDMVVSSLEAQEVKEQEERERRLSEMTEEMRAMARGPGESLWIEQALSHVEIGGIRVPKRS